MKKYKEGPTIEAQIVDIADSLAYLNHDIDDGLTSGCIKAEDLLESELWKKAVEKVMRAFESFKSTNDRELAEIKKGSADVITSEKLGRTNKAIDELKEEVAKLAKKANRPSSGATGEQAKIETKAVLEFARWIGSNDLVKAAEHRIAYKQAFGK